MKTHCDKNFDKIVDSIYKDLYEEGFEAEYIKKYLKKRIEKNINDLERGRPENVFHVFGYFVEYIINTKLIGCISHVGENPPRVIGYESTTHYTADKDILLENKKKIKSGQDYYTRVYPLCGKKR